MNHAPLDCLIIGAGPAGLTAALYLGRYRRRVAVVDAGHSRAALIPATHNYPGFPQGVGGAELLARLHRQILPYDVPVRGGNVNELTRDALFTARFGDERVSATTVLLATGTEDRQSELATPDTLRAGTLAGCIRWCPICDGYEGRDQQLGLLATSPSALDHALFLRTYTSRLTLMLPAGETPLAQADLARLQAAGIRMPIAAPMRIELTVADRVAVHFADGTQAPFDALYPMLGSTAQSSLATGLGARCDAKGELLVDEHQRTSVPGLYAAGDIVKALNQMTVGMAHAAVAATAIHHSLPTLWPA